MIKSKLEELTKLEKQQAGESEISRADDEEDQSQTAKGGNGILLAAHHELPPPPSTINGNGVVGRPNGVRDVEGLTGDVIHV